MGTGGNRTTILCHKEVVVSGGAIGSPQILQLSGLGPMAAPIAICFVAFQYLLLSLLRVCRPADDIEIAPDFPTEMWAQRRVKYEPLPVGSRFMHTLAERRRYVMNG